MCSWEKAKSLAQEHTTAAAETVFVKLSQDQQCVTGVFCGEPHAIEVVWNNRAYDIYDPEDPYHRSINPSLRIMINFFLLEKGVMKALEGGAVWFQKVVEARDKHGIEDSLFEIRRHGGPRDRNTYYTVRFLRKLTDTEQEVVDSADCHDLASLKMSRDR